jgi:putative phage-type endonuclease
MAKLNSGKPAAGRKNYVSELVAENLSGQPQDNGYTNAAMQWGIDTEPLAREAYEKETFCEVERVGMVIHPLMDFAAASPDGIVGDGLVEIKCPNTSTHIDTLLSGKVDRKYILQMQWQMACTEKDWCDFVSYDPRLPGHEIWIKRIGRDDDLIAEIESEVQSAYNEVTEIIAKLEAL